MIAHIREVTLLYRLPNPQEQVNHRELIIEYILQRITEKTFKSHLYVQSQKRERGLEERQILDAYATLVEESFRKFVGEHISFEEFLEENEHVRQFADRGLSNLDLYYHHKGYVHSIESLF